ANQILTALAFSRHLIQTLVQNRIAYLRLCNCRDRLRRAEDAGAEQVDVRDRRRGLSELVLRLCPDQVHLAKPEPRVIVAVVAVDVSRIDRPLRDAYALPFASGGDVRNVWIENERIPLTVLRRLAGDEVDLRAGKEDLNAPVHRIESGIGVGQSREAVPWRFRATVLVVVQRPHQEVQSDVGYIDVLDRENDFRREVVVGSEILPPAATR